MAQDSKIEWCTHTANIWWGCTKVHAGCDNCYAEYFSDVRYKNNLWGNDKPRKLVKKFWSDLDKFQKLAAVAGEVHRVFVGSMMDIFEKPMPVLGSDGLTIIDDMTKNISKEAIQGIHWVIQGGESGHNRRPFNTDWARFTAVQCIVEKIPYFFKQIDKVIPVPEDLLIREFPKP